MHTRQQDPFKKKDLGITVDNCLKLSTQCPGMVKSTVFCAAGEGREKKQKVFIGNLLRYAAVMSPFTHWCLQAVLGFSSQEW